MKPLSSSQRDELVHADHIARRRRERLLREQFLAAGTRCSAAFTVVSRIDGLSRPLTRASRDKRRHALRQTTPALGETRS